MTAVSILAIVFSVAALLLTLYNRRTMKNTERLLEENERLLNKTESMLRELQNP